MAAIFSFGLISECLAGEKPQVQADNASPEPQKAVVRTIFGYKKELELSDKQEERLKKLLAEFQNYLTGMRNELGQLQAELGDLIRSKAPLKSIKAKIDKITRAQGEVAYKDVETARNVEGVLTPAQLAKWNDMQEEFKKAAAAQAQAAQQAQGQAEAGRK